MLGVKLSHVSKRVSEVGWVRMCYITSDLDEPLDGRLKKITEHRGGYHHILHEDSKLAQP